MKSLPKLLILLALSCPLGSLAASAPALSAADPTSGIVEATLPNGLRVLVRPRHVASVVTTMMWHRVGSRDELPGATGLAHFLEHLMFRGTPKLPMGQMVSLTYQHGGPY